MARVFAYKSTASIGKYQTEMISDLAIGPVLKHIHASKQAIVCILVGCVTELDRHLFRYKAMGVAERDIVIFEHHYATYKRLQRAIMKRRLKCRIFNECMLKGIKRLASQGETISCVEFDGVCRYGTFEFDLYKIANQFEIPVLICEGSSRGQTPQFKAIARSLKMKRETYHGYKCFNLIPTAKRIIARKLRGYQSEIFTYMGVSNMYMQISIRNEVLL